jgi:hypothetical protein
VVAVVSAFHCDKREKMWKFGCMEEEVINRRIILSGVPYHQPSDKQLATSDQQYYLCFAQRTGTYIDIWMDQQSSTRYLLKKTNYDNRIELGSFHILFFVLEDIFTDRVDTPSLRKEKECHLTVFMYVLYTRANYLTSARLLVPVYRAQQTPSESYS